MGQDVPARFGLMHLDATSREVTAADDARSVPGSQADKNR